MHVDVGQHGEGLWSCMEVCCAIRKDGEEATQEKE
jgi:Na+-transporting NADH:ubiquinone oxidoreductase subunit NqrC